MISTKHITVMLLLGAIFLSNCTTTQPELATPIPTATKTPAPTSTPPPTPSSPYDSVNWRDLQVSMQELEITQEFVTYFGTTRVPSPGKKFLWIHIRLENTGNIEINIPGLENYSILYATTEIKPTYGYRDNYPEYSELGTIIFPGKELDGWLRFDIPAEAGLSDMRFVFLPESSQVGTSFSSPNYPYSNDKPAFVWKCGP